MYIISFFVAVDYYHYFFFFFFWGGVVRCRSIQTKLAVNRKTKFTNTLWLDQEKSLLSLSLSHWYPRSGVVLGCNDS